MKILPMTERWNEGERGWEYVVNPEASIKSWEQASGIQLPADYRGFMLKFNGGRVYPRRFYHSVPIDRLPGNDRYIQLGLLYSWKTVLSYQVDLPWKDTVPPKHLVIADTPGEVEILMALGEENFGSVYTWLRSRNKWGTAENNSVYLIAKSFTLFLKMQFDDESASDHDRFARPVYTSMIREFDIDGLKT